jgi:signal transduction histidine kinase/ligand-binding sensor domain-containing protein
MLRSFMLKRWILILWCAGLGLFALRAADSVNIPAARGGPLEDYQAEVWTTEHGLPQNSINWMAQTSDGYLWLATFNGLARFDGVRFVIFDAANTPELKTSRFIGLHADRDGGLWIISEFHEVTHYLNGRFRPIGRDLGAPEGGISVLGDDSTGNMWFGGFTGGGLFRMENGKLVKIFASEVLDQQSPMRLLLDEKKRLWTRTGNDLIRIDPPDLKRVSSPAKILGLGQDRKGRILAACPNGIVRFEDGVWHEIARFKNRANTLAKLIEDRHGSVWGATMDGRIWKSGEDGLISESKLSPEQNPPGLRAIFEDPEGSIWVGSNGAGLYRLKPKLIQMLTPEDGLTGNIVKSITRDAEGRIWALSQSGLNLLGSKPLRVESTSPAPTHNWVLCGDGQGYLWAGSYGLGLVRMRDGKAERAIHKGEPFPGVCLALHLDKTGRIWAGGEFGLAMLEGIEARPVPLPDKTGTIIAIAEDREGRLYFGTSGNGLLVHTGGQWQQLRGADYLPDDYVGALHCDKENAVWIGMTGHGLARLKDGLVFRFSETNRWPVRSIYSIIEDDLGFMWFGSNHGLFRVAREELNQFASGKLADLNVHRYSTGDGLATSEFTSRVQPAVCKGSDGKLWFATLKGVAVVDPREIAINTHPPSVIIEEVWADGQRVSSSANGGLRVQPGHRRLEFRYTALSFLAPEKVRFRVRLEGLDEDWIDAGTRRSIDYNRVPPGHYRFRVSASNNDGVWNKAGASAAIIMLPHFWQTRWFVTLIALGLAGGGFAAYHRRIRQLQHEQAAQQEFSRRLLEVQESERKRIAGELHDGLGQTLQLIRNRALLALKHGALSPLAENPLAEISEITSNAITEVRAITYALRPAELEQIGLSRALEWMIDNFSKGSGLRVLVQVDPIDNLLSRENEMNLYRIVQEGLNNVIKHAEATEATVEIKQDSFSLNVTIFDNGRGFIHPVAPRHRGEGGGMGLASVRERVRIMAGQHQINSTPGKGTRIQACIPLPGV